MGENHLGTVNFHRPIPGLRATRSQKQLLPHLPDGYEIIARRTLTRYIHAHGIIDWRGSPRATAKAVAITGIAGVALGKIQPVYILIRIMHR